MSRHLFIIILRVERLLVQPFLDDCTDGIITEVSIIYSPSTSHVQTITAHARSKAEDTLTCFISLFRMLPNLENTGYIIPGIASNKGCPLNELLRRPVAFKLVVSCL